LDIPPLLFVAPSKELPEIHGGPRTRQPTLPSTTGQTDKFVISIDEIMYGNSLTDPITFDHIKDVTSLENKWQEIRKEAKYIKQHNQRLDKMSSKPKIRSNMH
jgi:hypothetical protein